MTESSHFQTGRPRVDESRGIFRNMIHGGLGNGAFRRHILTAFLGKGGFAPHGRRIHNAAMNTHDKFVPLQFRQIPPQGGRGNFQGLLQGRDGKSLSPCEKLANGLMAFMSEHDHI